jgi:hypothetical protein
MYIYNAMKMKTRKIRKNKNKNKNKSNDKTRRRNNDSCVYSDKDFNSNDGMLTTVWGPAIWHSLHTISFNYPIDPSPEDKKNYKSFIMNLKNVLPCGKCRKNLKKNMKKLPLTNKDMESRNTFSKYIYDLHEVINTMLGKKSGLSYDDVKERYEHFRARCALNYEDIAKMKNDINEYMKKHPGVSEKGCTEPLYGEKSKCIIHIVPQNDTSQTFQIDDKCIKKKLIIEKEK